MTCPHKYAGRNPSVVYPAWRTLDQTLNAYGVIKNFDGVDRILDMIADANPEVKTVTITADWPRAEVEALMAALEDFTEKHWARGINNALMSHCSIQTIKLHSAYHALKGKMG